MQRNFPQRLASSLLLAAIALGATATTSSAAGGLSISPSTIEREAKPGSIGAIRVTNGSSKAIDISVRARPWLQSSNGAVRPNDKSQLSQIRLTGATFRLAAGATRSVPAALLSKPSSGSLYGTISVIGTPVGQKPKNGVITRYRLLSGLRLNPAASARKFRAAVGNARYSSGATLVPVRNAGNTVEPITGTATISGPSGTRRANFTAMRIIPGATVDLRLPHGKLSKGSYKVAIKLEQAGRRIATLNRSIKVK